jgi:hypothetical protein
VPDATTDRRKLWRHVIQCLLAEHIARSAGDEKALTTAGIRLDAAIDALDETLTERQSA